MVKFKKKKKSIKLKTKTPKPEKINCTQKNYEKEINLLKQIKSEKKNQKVTKGLILEIKSKGFIKKDTKSKVNHTSLDSKAKKTNMQRKSLLNKIKGNNNLNTKLNEKQNKICIHSVVSKNEIIKSKRPLMEKLLEKKIQKKSFPSRLNSIEKQIKSRLNSIDIIKKINNQNKKNIMDIILRKGENSYINNKIEKKKIIRKSEKKTNHQVVFGNLAKKSIIQ